MKFTKLFYVFLATVLVAGFSACGSDNDDNVSIVGTWAFSNPSVNRLIVVETNNAKLTEAIRKEVENSFTERDYTYTFKADGTVMYDEVGDEQGVGRYVYTGNNLTITYASDDIEKTTVVLSGNKMTSTYDNIDEYDRSVIVNLIQNDPTLVGIDTATVSVSKVHLISTLYRK
ncbi:MAG: hypothetical protein RL662_446 [Bacteroidota bacterium]|jgi:hypothetical protein